MVKVYESQSARDAQASNYGDESYWDHLDQHAQEMHDFFVARGDQAQADLMFIRGLAESLVGNDGE